MKKNFRSIGSRTEPDRSFKKHETHGVAEVFKRIEGIDSGESFAPASGSENLLTIPLLAVKQNFTLKQMNFRSAFLHNKTREEFFRTATRLQKA